MYKKVSTDMNFVSREKEVEKFWDDNEIFQKSMDEKEGCPDYIFYDGPPTANGKPHIGHVLTRVIKDMIPRYRTMKGYMVPRKAGWDTHGLPVELEVEKLLGLDGKDQIEKYGLEPFIKKCKESVWKYKGMWENFSGTVGFWADMEHPYVTYDNNFIESEWWALKQIWDKGLLYKGFKIVPYCPRCGTPLSAQEVAQGYKDVKERSAIVRFKVKDEDAYILAWTTTPWTLPSNLALCVNPKEDYAKVKAADGHVYYMACALLDTVLGRLAEEGKDAYEILETYKGTDLEGKEYEPLYQCAADEAAKQRKKAFYVVCDEYVTLTDGTGVVHIAPAFGEDDANVGRKYDLPFVQLVDEKGDMAESTPFAGLFVKKADPEVLKDLDARGLLYDAPKFEHSYPHCWRCDTPLIYYARESWFIKMTAVREDLIRNNNTINWIPESIGKGRFGDWIENVQDWGISRNRYWGTPLNIWQCECGHMHSVGSIAELKEMSDNCPDNIELHRPYIDNVVLTCPKCGGPAKRETDTMPQWAGSSWYFLRYMDPHNPDALASPEALNYWAPVDWYNGGMEHTTLHLLYSRFWHKFLYDIGVVPTKEPYQKRTSHGMILGQNGEKMSKSRGNVVNPDEIVDQYGADTMRLYEMFIGDFEKAAPWNSDSIKGCKRFLERYWNLQTMVTPEETYSNDLETLMHQTIQKVTEDIDQLKCNTAIAALMTLLNKVYDKGSITRGELRTLTVLLNPFAPHVTEEMWEVEQFGGMVHEAQWPAFDPAKTKEDTVEIVLQVLGKVRSRMTISADTPKEEVLAAAKADSKIAALLEGKTIKKEIYVPGKLVNFVAI